MLHIKESGVHMKCLFLVLISMFIISCGDSPIYNTKLPNGYSHNSNGGEFGSISHTQYGLNKYTSAFRDAGKEKWCNHYSWSDNLIICKLTEYGDRAFVDPPKSIEYLIIDTKTYTSHIFISFDKANKYWKENTNVPFPELKKFHKETNKWKGKES